MPANRTLRHITVLVGGTAGAQLIALLASPLLTRLYTPDQFGFLAVFSALMNSWMVIASLRYQAAIPLARDDRAGIATVLLSVYVGIGVALVTLALVFVFGERFAALLNASEYAPWLYLLPPAVLIAGWFEVFRGWSVRKQTFGRIAQARVQQSFAMTLIQVSGFRFGVAALVVGQVVGRAAGLGRLFVPFREASRGQLSSFRAGELMAQAREFRRFPLHSTWGTLLNVTGRQLPAVFFAVIGDAAVAGLFALAQRVLSAPLSLVTDAISGVFMSVGVRAEAGGRLLGAVETFNGALCRLVAIPLFAVVLVGQDVFALVFGAEWADAGRYAALMAPWIYTVLISTSLIAVFSITSHDRELSTWQLTLAVARVLALFAGWKLGSAEQAIVLFSLVSSVAYLAMTMRVHVLAGGSAITALRPLAVSLGWALAVLSPMWVSMFVLDGAWLWSGRALAAALAVLYYVRLLRRLLSDPHSFGLRLNAADPPPD